MKEHVITIAGLLGWPAFLIRHILAIRAKGRLIMSVFDQIPTALQGLQGAVATVEKAAETLTGQTMEGLAEHLFEAAGRFPGVPAGVASLLTAETFQQLEKVAADVEATEADAEPLLAKVKAAFGG